MSTTTALLSLKKAVGADLARDYLKVDLAATLDILDNAVTLTAAQVLTNKTLTAPAINGTVTTTGLTLPALTLGGNVTATGRTITGGAYASPTLSGTIAGAPIWASDQLITLATAAQPNVTSLGVLTALFVSGTLTLTAAASKIVPGVTSLALRNNADSADNLLISDAGAATVRGTLVVNGTSGDVAAYGGKAVVTNTSSGAATVGLVLVNAASAASTAVALDFTPNTNVSLARITALRTNTGFSGATDLVFSSWGGSNLVEGARITSAGALTVASSLTVGGTLVKAASVAAGGVLFGAGAAVTTSNGENPGVQMHGSAGHASFAAYRYSADTGAPLMIFAKSRSGTVGTPGTIVASGDELARIVFCGDDGVNLLSRAAMIKCVVDGTPGATTDMPGRVEIHTTPDGSATPSCRFIIGTTGLNVGATKAVRGTTEPTNAINLYDGTAPAGTLTNGVTLYSAAGELRSMDAAGNSTLLSPHDDEGKWVFDSVAPDGRHLRIDVEKLLRFLNDHHGLDFVHDLVGG